MKKKTYIVWVSYRTKFRVRADSARQARQRAWNVIKDGYTYGWKNRAEFMKKAKVVLV